MEEPQVNLKDPWIAALLAFLLPGLGHLYQGRLLKAAIYAVCILSLFAWGMNISEGKIVQAPTNRPGTPRSKTFSYAAQAGVGLPALYAYYQAKRWNAGEGQPVSKLYEEADFNFTGSLEIQNGNDDIEDAVTGTLRVAPARGRFGDSTIIGRFDGTTQSGDAVEVILGEGVELGPVLKPDPNRYVFADVVDEIGDDSRLIGTLKGTIPRGLWDRLEAPMSEQDEEDLHGHLGKMHELALVFTWIAGLLNLLAIWDAFEGPAYGYGLVDETADNSNDPAGSPDAPPATDENTKADTPHETARKAG